MCCNLVQCVKYWSSIHIRTDVQDNVLCNNIWVGGISQNSLLNRDTCISIITVLELFTTVTCKYHEVYKVPVLYITFSL